MSKNLVIIYGRGHDWNFKVFADSLKKNLFIADAKNKITVKEITTDQKFVDFLNAWPSTNPIDELHIFSHSIGSGLYPGYGDPAVSTKRDRILNLSINRKKRLSYDEVRKTETGGILTDDLHYPPFSNNKNVLQKKFSSTGSIKLWGCNSAISNWEYSDPDSASRPIYDPANKSASYFYWRALNMRHIPKSSIAKALASFFNVNVYGASSGSHIEVHHRGKWVTSDVYKKQFGKYPPGTLPHRLHPDKGNYMEFKP